MHTFWQAINPKAQDNVKQSMVLLYRMRWIAIIGQVVISLVAEKIYGFLFPFDWLLTIVAFEVALQIGTIFRMMGNESFPQFELFLHLGIDSLFLTGIVFLTGGTSNPFTYLLLIPIALGAFMLTVRQLISLTVIACMMYSLLHFKHVPLNMTTEHHTQLFDLHMAGMWINFAISALLLAVFGIAARKVLLQQQHQLQQLREKQLKDEQILSLGIMSASATHELGTPLSSMAIIADDLLHDGQLEPGTQEDIQLLRSQINRCEDIIQSLSLRSETSRKTIAEGNQNPAYNNLGQQLKHLINSWECFKPQIQLTIKEDPSLNEINKLLGISVEQAITNLLDNAAEASLENQNNQLTIELLLKAERLEIVILDFGRGIPDKMKQLLGKQILESDKESGFGWGHFLSNASIERVGGNVSLIEQEGGMETRIQIPLDKEIP